MTHPEAWAYVVPRGRHILLVCVSKPVLMWIMGDGTCVIACKQRRGIRSGVGHATLLERLRLLASPVSMILDSLFWTLVRKNKDISST